MKFIVELRDKDFNVKERLERESLDLRWSYSRIGGCGEFRFKLPRKRLEEKIIRGDFNVRIYYRNPITNSFDLWYQGLIEVKTPNVRGNTEDIEVVGHGYNVQLRRIYLNNVTYTSMEVSVIIKHLLDNYIVPYTNISYSASDIEATSVTLDSIQFNEDVNSAIEKLADLVGTREWGVDKNRNFFFKQRSSVIGHRFFTGGGQLQNFQDNQDFTGIVNSVLVQGAQTGGTYFTAGPFEDLQSQQKYNLREQIIQNSSITTTAVASQFASAILEEFKEVTRKATCDIAHYIADTPEDGRNLRTAELESTNPIPLFAEISRKVKYGQKKYGTFLYSGIVGRTINRINYSYTNNGGLNISLDLGQLRPTLAEDIANLEYQLEQQRTAAL